MNQDQYELDVAKLRFIHAYDDRWKMETAIFCCLTAQITCVIVQYVEAAYVATLGCVILWIAIFYHRRARLALNEASRHIDENWTASWRKRP